MVTGTSITGLNGTITKPNDQIELFFDIKNNGTINAKISSIEISKLCTLQSSVESCDWNNDGTVTQEDIDKVNDNISFKVIYLEGGHTGRPLQKKESLNAGESIVISAIIDYSKVVETEDSFDIVEATELPKRDLIFNDLSFAINYVQAD